MNNLWKSVSCLVNRMTFSLTNSTTSTFTNNTVSILQSNHPSPLINEIFPKRFKMTLEDLRRRHLKQMAAPPKKSKNPLGPNKPFAKGLVLKNVIKKPRKPNSANRKCVVVKLSSGKEVIAYVPGEGHNLQEHQYVLCRVGNLKDVPGVKVKCVRGAYDLPHVKKKTN